MTELAGPPVFRENLLIKGVLVRHLVLPGQFADAIRIIETVHNRWTDRVLFSLMGQYTPVEACRDHPTLSKRVGRGQYRALVKHASGMNFLCLFVQDESAADASYIQQFDGTWQQKL
jgi:putative pyruvate formate lyase activating enzyme